MSKFFIKSLIISGENKRTSTLDFDEGLNIIYGPSNTGKTYVLKWPNNVWLTHIWKMGYAFGLTGARFNIHMEFLLWKTQNCFVCIVTHTRQFHCVSFCRCGEKNKMCCNISRDVSYQITLIVFIFAVVSALCNVSTLTIDVGHLGRLKGSV